MKLTLGAALSKDSFLMAASQRVPDSSRRVASFTKGFFSVTLAACAYSTNVAVLSSVYREVKR
jgi:hypothetical protein